MKNEVHARLCIQRLKKMVRIGCEASERASPQPVSFDISISFTELPSACRTDKIENTVCYGKISQVIDSICRGREFHLIEYLAASVYEDLQLQLPSTISLSLRLTKLHPPIDGLEGGASFILGEPRPEWLY